MTVLAIVLVAGTVAGVVLAAVGRGFGAAWPYAVQGPTAAVAFGIPAVLVLRHEARSLMGWLLALDAVLLVTAQFATSWAWLSLVGRPGSLSGGPAALWLGVFPLALTTVAVPASRGHRPWCPDFGRDDLSRDGGTWLV